MPNRFQNGIMELLNNGKRCSYMDIHILQKISCVDLMKNIGYSFRFSQSSVSDARWSSLVTRKPHTLEIEGSNPSRATIIHAE